MSNRPGIPFVLVIFDGWGIAPRGPGNAITLAQTPVMNFLTQHYPSTTLSASGAAVGLPPNQEGNSEAGHINIGAGRVVEQDSVRISKAINEGSFFKNAAFRAAIHHVRKYRSHLHIMGLLTEEQSAHADPDHLLALLTLSRNSLVHPVLLHLFTDGRDSSPRAALKLVGQLEQALSNDEKIATIIGRFYAMDRKKVWERTKRTYEAVVFGKGQQSADAVQAVHEAYERGENDEFVSPTVIGNRRQNRIRANDSVIFYNLRSDRARQLAKVFVQKKFHAVNPRSFVRHRLPKNVLFVAMTDFGPDLGDIYTAFPSVDIYNSLPMVLTGFRQLYVAESEKYAHVTFFFNGGYDRPVANEDRVSVPSPNVKSYDAAPDMSVRDITTVVLESIRNRTHDFIVVNFANPDMLGHTGNLGATIRAIETVDECVGKIRNALIKSQGILMITADHGNAEEMLSTNGTEVNTEHSRNPVPFVLVAPHKFLPHRLRSGGCLADVSPTILDLLGIQKPVAMHGTSLIIKDYATET